MTDSWADIVTGEHEIMSHRRRKNWFTANWQLATIMTLILLVVWAAGFIAGYVVLR